jgi:hypothetical protein
VWSEEEIKTTARRQLFEAPLRICRALKCSGNDRTRYGSTPVRMRKPYGKYTGVIGEALEFERPRLYSMTFNFTNCDAPVYRATHKRKEF